MANNPTPRKVTVKAWLKLAKTGAQEVRILDVTASRPAVNGLQAAVPVELEVDMALFNPEPVAITVNADHTTMPTVKRRGDV